ADPAMLDFRLQSNSPCIDAGYNTASVAARDADGIPRPLDGDANGVAEVDLGAFERVHPLADSDSDGLRDTNELAWGSSPADSDTDDDGMNDGEEMWAGTDALDPLSLFQLTKSLPVSNGEIMIRWSSTSNKQYALSRFTNLLADALALATNIPATPPENVYTDVTAGLDAQFYRVGVEP
ncbi:MAG: thrombospondin type 3 repeat-containing protein, partial [bacterium]